MSLAASNAHVMQKVQLQQQQQHQHQHQQQQQQQQPQQQHYDKNSGACNQRLSVLLPSLSLILIASGFLFPLILESIVHHQMQEKLAIRNGSLLYKDWILTPELLHFQIWLWNITNPSEILEDGRKPKLQQVGPFTFFEQRYKEQVNFHPNGTVSFKQRRRFFYSAEQSGVDIQRTMITTVNLAYISAAREMQNKPVSLRRIAHRFLLLHSGNIFVTKTAEQLLLGYEDQALLKLQPLRRSFGFEIPYRIGLFIDVNETDSGNLLIDTGVNDIRHLNHVLRWRGQKLSQLPAAAAGAADAAAPATDGSMFPPGVKNKQLLTIFSPEICGTAGFKFTGNALVYDLPTLVYAPFGVGPGYKNVTSCMHGAPLYLTAPHFRHCTSCQQLIGSGLDPKPDYETRLKIEPVTGLVVQANRLMQMNARIERILGFKGTMRFGQNSHQQSHVYLMPLMWVNETGSISEPAANQLYTKLLLPLQIAGTMQWVLISLGAVCLAAAIFICYNFCCTCKSALACSYFNTHDPEINIYVESFLPVGSTEQQQQGEQQQQQSLLLKQNSHNL